MAAPDDLKINTISFLLEAAVVLATLVPPNHIVCLCSWGFTYLPLTCNSKLFGYKLLKYVRVISETKKVDKIRLLKEPKSI
ncbi:hypothetical protein DMC15_05465 [Vibrio sp. 11986-1-5]|nr:hypothetical protein DMC15_05465 [Vibrio sp. 11986-1-5]